MAKDKGKGTGGEKPPVEATPAAPEQAPTPQAPAAEAPKASEQPSPAANSNVKAEPVKLTEAQREQAQAVITAQEKIDVALKPAREAYSEYTKLPKDAAPDVVTAAQAKASKALKDGLGTVAEERKIVKTAAPEVKAALKGFKNGAFGEYRLARTEKNMVGAGYEAAKNSFKGEWKNNKPIAFVKGAGVLFGGYLLVDAFRSKTANDNDRSWVSRVSEGVAGAALVAGSAVAGKVR